MKIGDRVKTEHGEGVIVEFNKGDKYPYGVKLDDGAFSWIKHSQEITLIEDKPTDQKVCAECESTKDIITISSTCAKDAYICSDCYYKSNLTIVDMQDIEKPTLDANNHSSHYENQPIEAIDVQEALIIKGIPEEYHTQLMLNYRSAMLYKYIGRLGLKDAPSKEIDKIQNWAERLQTGKWRT